MNQVKPLKEFVASLNYEQLKKLIVATAVFMDGKQEQAFCWITHEKAKEALRNYLQGGE